MSKKVSSIVNSRLAREKFTTDQEHLNAAKEVVQEIALLSLSRQGLFDTVAFQGGTAFRIFYGLDRFSEDLDFALIKPNLKFSLAPMLKPMREEFEHWGLTLEVTDRSKVDSVVQKAFLKETSLGAVLTLDAALPRSQKLKIKIEIDTNPPPAAQVESHLCDFPTDYYVTCYDLPTMFAGKLHALLCRKYGKGRDWYDLVEYLRRRTKPNYEFLKNALVQLPPWDARNIPEKLDFEWVRSALIERMQLLSIDALRADVEPFVRGEQKLALWSAEYFTKKLSLIATL